MKKKLLFCIHNHFYLKHYILDLKKLEKDFEISILTSNYLIKNPKLEKDSIFREIKIKDIFFIPFYKTGLERSMSTIFLQFLEIYLHLW